MGSPAAELLKRLRSKLLAGTISSAAAAYIWYYYRCVCELPQLYFHPDSSVSAVVQQHCNSLYNHFRPTPWLWMPDAQTLFGILRTFSRSSDFERQIITCSDGGLIALDWWRDSKTGPDLSPFTPIVLVMHGLAGGSTEGYCKWMCHAARCKGWRVAVINYRGCGGLKLTTPITYNAAYTDDVRVAINTIKADFPHAPLAAVSYSLGSMILTKYCATYEDDADGTKLKCAVMISNPFCMSTAQRKVEIPFTMGWVYNLGMAFLLKRYVHEHKDQLGDKINLDAVAECWTLRHFEESVLCQLFGYNNTHEYYEDGSSVHFINKIRTPSLFLISKDDPFLGRLPLPECQENPSTVLAVTNRGGHVAFLQGLWPFGRSWMDTVSCEFLAPYLDAPVARL